MKQSTCITLGFCQYNLIDSTYNLKNQLSIQQQQQHLRPASFQTTTSSSVLSAIANSDEENDSNDSIDNVQLPRTQQQDPSMFFELMSPIDTVKPEQMSASSLAYLGDVVFELFVRSRYVWPSRRMSDLQNKVVSVVRAEAQSILLQKFIESFTLTSEEQAVLSRGRNANLTARKKGKSANNAKGASAYQDSTAFEALIGYTYITDKQRFIEIISWMKDQLDEMDDNS